MRKELEKIEEVRGTFTGVFVRKGTKNGYMCIEETILLKDVKNSEGKLMTDHLWFNYTKGFQKLGTLKEGDVIQFDARCKSYLKGYKGYRMDVYKPLEWDYKLSHPTKLKKL